MISVTKSGVGLSPLIFLTDPLGQSGVATRRILRLLLMTLTEWAQGFMNLGLRYLFLYTKLLYLLYMRNLFDNYIIQRSVLSISAIIYKVKKVGRQACA